MIKQNDDDKSSKAYVTELLMLTTGNAYQAFDAEWKRLGRQAAASHQGNRKQREEEWLFLATKSRKEAS